MADESIRDALREYAGPVPPPPDARRSVLDRLARRRRRRAAAGGVVAAVVLAGGVLGTSAVLADGSSEEPAPADRTSQRPPVPTDTWRQTATAPLTPRHDSVGAWTGEELVVAGGTTGFICPPMADCPAPPPSAERADGAAYDPVTDNWRAIAPAPQPFAGGLAAWTGTEVVVVTRETTLAYDPDADSWRELDAPPVAYLAGVVATPDGLVFHSYDKGTRGQPTDWRLDPVTGTWAALPDDPFDESYDRSLAWDGERLWLLSMDVKHHFGAHEGAPSRLAVLDGGLEGGLEGGQWREVAETPDLGYGDLLWWSQGRLVSNGFAFDPATETFTEGRRAADDDGCRLPAAGVGPTWVSGAGATLLSDDPDVTTTAPDCPQLADPDVAVWADEQLLLWGGADPDYENSATGLVWTPPAP